MPRPSRTRRIQSQLMRSKALPWSAKTAAGQESASEGARLSTSVRTRGARSPSTCSQRPDARSTGVGGAGPELKCSNTAAMLGPH
eukprot:1626182-Alexandrium_andersonii.AAC.1